MNREEIFRKYFDKPLIPAPVRFETRWTRSFGLELFVLPLNKTSHPIGGNKWFKLKYNLAQAISEDTRGLLTFGGGFSNHISAVAKAARLLNLKSLGIIRGDELHEKSNPVLEEAGKNGMEFKFIDRESYRNKNEKDFLVQLKSSFPDFYLIPEGGSNEHGIKGAAEIADLIQIPYDYLALAVGSGGTLAGLAGRMKPSQKVLGFPVMARSEYLEVEIEKMIPGKSAAYELIHGYHFGRFGAGNRELEQFMKDLKLETGIITEHVYTGKLFYGLSDQIQKGRFVEGEKIVVIHTGSPE